MSDTFSKVEVITGVARRRRLGRHRKSMSSTRHSNRHVEVLRLPLALVHQGWSLSGLQRMLHAAAVRPAPSSSATTSDQK